LGLAGGRARRAFGVAAIALAAVHPASSFHGRIGIRVLERIFVAFQLIAVDYLIYTREVIGNIRESYRMTPILLGLAAATAIVVAAAVKPLWRAAQSPGPGFGRRSLWMGGYIAMALASLSASSVDVEGVL